MARPKKPELMGVIFTYYCYRCKEQKTASKSYPYPSKTDKYIDFSSSEGDCGMCGSHGEVNVSFKCDCGSDYEFELKSW